MKNFCFFVLVFYLLFNFLLRLSQKLAVAENLNHQRMLEESRLQKLVENLTKEKEDISAAKDRAFQLRDQSIAEAFAAKDDAATKVWATESKAEQLLLQANSDHHQKCLEVATQCSTRFERLMEISGCEAFRLSWDQALMDPSARRFSNPEAFDAISNVEPKNYNFDYYIERENLAVPFVDELEEATETHQSQGSESGRPGGHGEEQADSKGKKAIEGASSDQVNIPSGPVSGGFDDNVTIEFSSSLLRTLDAPNLLFLDQDKTP